MTVELERGRQPGEHCEGCTVKRGWVFRGTQSRREPCATIMDEFKKTRRGSGLEPGEVPCLASLQAELNRTSE